MDLLGNTESPRAPGRRIESNSADKIERQLHEDGHEIWAWVIQCSTHGNEDD